MDMKQINKMLLDLREQELPMRLYVFEAKELLCNAEDAQRFLKTHKNIGEVANLAFVEQYHREGREDEPHFVGARTELREGERFRASYYNQPLLPHGKPRKPEKLADKIKLTQYLMALPTSRGKEYWPYGDEKDTVRTTLIKRLHKAVFPPPRAMSWQDYGYPSLSIAVICDPRYTEKVLKAAESLGNPKSGIALETKVYRAE